MNIFVTGASGFIGRYLCQELVRDKHRLFVLSRPASDLAFLSAYQNVHIVYGDITDYASLLSAIPEGIDICFHCAARVEDASARKLFRVNADGTRCVCEACCQKGIRKLVYLSSIAVINGNPEVPLTDDLAYSATNAYGASKIEAEKIAISYRQKGVSVAVFRPCVVYGQGEPHLMDLLARLIKRRWLFLLGEAQQRWHLVYVKNVVGALLEALSKDAAYSGTFLVADTDALTVREVFSVMAGAMGARPPRSIPERFVPFVLRLPYIGRKLRYLVKDRVYSIERLQRVLQYSPSYRVKEALSETAAYYKNRAPR